MLPGLRNRVCPRRSTSGVWVAEEKGVKILLLCGIAGAQQRSLHAVGVAVAQEDPPVFQTQQLLRRLVGAEVAVAGHLPHRDVRELILQPLRVPPAVAQMKDHTGRFLLYRPDHIGKIPVGIGEDENVHEMLPFLKG